MKLPKLLENKNYVKTLKKVLIEVPCLYNDYSIVDRCKKMMIVMLGEGNNYGVVTLSNVIPKDEINKEIKNVTQRKKTTDINQVLISGHLKLICYFQAL